MSRFLASEPLDISTDGGLHMQSTVCHCFDSGPNWPLKHKGLFLFLGDVTSCLKMSTRLVDEAMP